MFNFCTLFDSSYLSRGLALYFSLKKYCNDFHLYIFAFDDICFNILKQFNLENATVISLKEFEDEELLKVKPSRTIAEYCWTSTSSTILYVLKNFKVESCTYIDADIFFYSSPKPIFDEIENSSILLTEHRYSPHYNKELKAGKYCVQFITFKNDKYGLTALNWWRDRCIDWCYNKYEDGKFGDQLYLNDWTTRFENVHVMNHLGGGLAAWNVQQYNFFYENKKLFGKEISSTNIFEVIFYHFHYLRFFTNEQIELGRRVLSKDVKKIFYCNYINYLDSLKEKINSYKNNFDPHGSQKKPLNWKSPILYLYRNIKGVYNIYDKEKFLQNNSG